MVERHNRLLKVAVEYLWSYSKLDWTIGATWTDLEVGFVLSRRSDQMIYIPYLCDCKGYAVLSILLTGKHLVQPNHLCPTENTHISSVSEKGQMFIKQVQETGHSKMVYMQSEDHHRQID